MSSVTEERFTQGARFTNIEKQILFELYQQHEDIIDIKYRKKSRSKMATSVRQCWEQIVEIYNSNPNITTPRNLKQVQKFWLNARLRKKYPNEVTAKNAELIKYDTDLSIEVNQNVSSEEYEEINDIDSCIEEVEESNEEYSQIEEISEISDDKLTLTDLLNFKSNCPKVEVNNIDSQVVYEPQNPSELGMEECPLETPIGVEDPKQHHTELINSNHLNESVEERINHFKLKEAELKYKEQEIHLQQRKLELMKARIELQNMKELHQLQVEEMKMKIKILSESDKNTENK